ncbi:MAG: 23S rRNA (uridine2552-2'-O)-methyltransferase [Lentimonas sp.]|jgi:23S rRNA (uridine2552-2'-O)-methyltransferase
MIRNKFTKVKNAKKRKTSSTNWLRRHINDPFVKEAQYQGYRSRSAFKIIEIDEKFKIFKKGKIILDLGSTPGGWSQIASQKAGRGKVFALDILEMDRIEGVEFLQQDFLSTDAHENIINLINQNNPSENPRKCDVILSDMAGNACGDAKTDHLRIVALLEEALDFSIGILAEKGVFVGKIFQGGASGDLLQKFRANFTIVKHFKPESSRKESSENYIVATGFKSKQIEIVD